MSEEQAVEVLANLEKDPLFVDIMRFLPKVLPSLENFWTAVDTVIKHYNERMPDPDCHFMFDEGATFDRKDDDYDYRTI